MSESGHVALVWPTVEDSSNSLFGFGDGDVKIRVWTSEDRKISYRTIIPNVRLSGIQWTGGLWR
jgi:hypothetical protein